MDPWFKEEQIFQETFGKVSIPHGPHIILRIHVVIGRKISVGLSDWVDAPDAQLSLKCSSTFFTKEYKTQLKMNTVNPEWDEHFTFVIAEADKFDETSKYVVKLETKLYDVDRLGLDDYLGKVELDLTSLKLGEEKEITLQFETHGEVDIVFRKELKKDLDLRRSYKLCDEELKFRQMRKPQVMKALQKFLGKDGPKNLGETPTISIATSGGGFRAMMASAGFMEGLFKLDLFPAITYWSALSGSSWYMAMSYLKNAYESFESLVSFNNNLRSSCESHLLKCLLNPMFIKAYLDHRQLISKENRPITLVNLFGFALGWTFLSWEDINKGLSDTKNSVTEASLPFHMMTAVHVRDNIPLSNFRVGVEMNAFEISAPLYGVHVPTELYNSDWSCGIVLRKLPEFPIHYHMGAAGSVFAILAQKTSKTKTGEDKAKTKPLEGDLEDELELETVNAVNQSDDAVKDESDPAVVDEDQDEEQEVRRAAKILNFQFQLPEQKCCFLNPFLEEGKNVMQRSITCESNTIKLVDAGLSCNVPTEHVLRPQRTTDILIVLEAAMHKDQELDFGTLLTAGKQARQEGLKFPKFTKEKLLKDKFKELYVIEDEDNDPECPVVLWFTLSTRKFCKVTNYHPIHGQPPKDDDGEPFNSFPGSFAKIYHTYLAKSSPLVFDRLRELSRFNLLENKDVLLEKIAERIRMKRDAMKK